VKAAPFQYHAPETLDETIDLLGRFEDDAKVIAGGQSLVPVLALRLSRFDHLVDLQRVPGLRGVSRSNGSVRVAAMTTHTAVGRDAEAKAVPLLERATPYIGHAQIRNRGTVGGSLAHADPAAEWPAVALALDAELEVVGPDGTRRVPAAEFFLGTWTTSLEPSEVVVAAYFPVWTGTCGFAVEEAARRHGDFAMAGVVCGIEVAGDRVERAALAFLGVGGTPVRAGAAEAALTGAAVADLDLAALAALAVEGIEPPDDLHASAVQRIRMSTALAQRAMTAAINEATQEVRDA
jgi:carbon-monoxide dehydrogenase medium subunit